MTPSRTLPLGPVLLRLGAALGLALLLVLPVGPSAVTADGASAATSTTVPMTGDGSSGSGSGTGSDGDDSVDGEPRNGPDELPDDTDTQDLEDGDPSSIWVYPLVALVVFAVLLAGVAFAKRERNRD